MIAMRRFVWRHPHWWVIALCGAAWIWLALRWTAPHVHGVTAIDWTLMIATMMLPLVFDHLRVTAARSLWRRRQRAMIGFLCGYAAIWIVAGAAVALVLEIAGAPLHLSTPWIGAVAFAAAAAWQIAPVKRRALAACHRTVPLAPAGWRADADCARYGWTIGRSCLVSCAWLMLACLLAGHSLPAMAATTAVVGAERINPRVDARTTAAVLALLAVTPFAG